MIKVVASDGFLSGESISKPFQVEEGPVLLSILCPETGIEIVSSARLFLRAKARTPESGEIENVDVFEWESSLDGMLGTGPNLRAPLLSVGTHEIKVSATSEDGRSAERSVEVNLLEDRDGDGIADSIEDRHPNLDADNGDDAFLDDDLDGLSNASEVLQFNSDPSNPDSDGDGASDGDEFGKGSSPTAADSDGDGIGDFQDNCPAAANPRPVGQQRRRCGRRLPVYASDRECRPRPDRCRGKGPLRFSTAPR